MSEAIDEEPADEGQKTQVVTRVAELLSRISREGPRGARLKDLALDTGIARSSVHRLLGELCAVKLVQQGPDRRYTLGQAMFSLGLSAPSPIRDFQRLRALAQALADECGDVVYLSLRQFHGVHYLLRAEGDYPIRTHLVSVGETKPFTASYSGLALLAHMDEETQRQALHRLALDAPEDWIQAHRARLERSLREHLADTQRLGYCAGPNTVMPGVAGMAAPVLSRSQKPYMALSISAVEHRLNPDRVQALAPSLLKTAALMSEWID